MKNLWTCIILVFLIPVALFGQNRNNKTKVLIVDGFSNHNWKQTTLVVKTILEKSGLFQVSVSTSPSEPNDLGWQSWNPKFNDFDVVMLNCNNIFNKEIRWPRKIETRLEKYLKKGGSLYILHSANNAFSDWPEYNRMIGLGWRKPEEGMALQVSDDGKIIKIPVGEGRSTYHGPRHDALIHKLGNHPINKDFPEAWLTPDMELYKFARGPAENLTVISWSKDPETGMNWPVEWVVAYGKGRVYNSSMGHLWKGETWPVGYRCVGFQTTIIRATEWLATGKTTYKLPKEFPSASKMVLKEMKNY